MTESFFNKKYTYALIGASHNPEKYGYKVLRSLTEAGFFVLPVNPAGGKILGKKVYEDIDDIMEDVDVAIFVVPPQVTEKVLSDVIKKGIKKVWLQPGSESTVSIALCAQKNIACQHSACIMMEQLKYIK